MEGKVIKIAFTRGDHATLPGGIILRELREGEFAAHHFSRGKGKLTPDAFFWGTYGSQSFCNEAFKRKLEGVKDFEVTKRWVLYDEVKS